MFIYDGPHLIVELTRLVGVIALKGWIVLALWPKPFIVVKVRRHWTYFGRTK